MQRKRERISCLDAFLYVEKWIRFFGPFNGKTKVDSFVGHAAFLGQVWLELLIYFHRLSAVKGLVRAPVVVELKPPGLERRSALPVSISRNYTHS